MIRKARMSPKLERSLEPGPACSSLKPARRQRVKGASMLVACIVAAFIASGALLLALDQGTEPPEVVPGVFSDLGAPPMSYQLWGFTKDSVGTALPSTTVTVTNVDKGTTGTVTSDGTGIYSCELVYVLGEPYYEDGDEILIEAVNGALSGSVTHIVDDINPVNQVDVVLSTTIPEFSMVILPVVGMLALFAVVGLRRRKAEA